MAKPFDLTKLNNLGLFSTCSNQLDVAEQLKEQIVPNETAISEQISAHEQVAEAHKNLIDYCSVFTNQTSARIIQKDLQKKFISDIVNLNQLENEMLGLGPSLPKVHINGDDMCAKIEKLPHLQSLFTAQANLSNR